MKTVVVDQTSWAKIRVTGEDRVRFLQGILSNDVEGLAVGAFCKATLLSAKGRVLSVVDAVKREEDVILVCEPALGEKTRELLDRYILADDVELDLVAMPCHRVWDTPAAVWTAPPVFEAREGSAEDEVEIRRVEGGLPKYGVDVSEDHFPFEANLHRALHYEKGCYVGQEVVARAAARGHANRRLMGLRLAGDARLLPGTTIASEARPDAGHVTSSVVSPEFGPIALGYLHRSSWEPGTKVRVGSVEATVTALPFGS